MDLTVFPCVNIGYGAILHTNVMMARNSLAKDRFSIGAQGPPRSDSPRVSRIIESISLIR